MFVGIAVLARRVVPAHRGAYANGAGVLAVSSFGVPSTCLLSIALNEIPQGSAVRRC